MKRDRGAATIWALAVGLVLVLFAAAMAQVGMAITARRKAHVAADLAALAGAARALEGVAVACGRARDYAIFNGAALSACRLDGFDLIVSVTIPTRFGTATATARAGPVPDSGVIPSPPDVGSPDEAHGHRLRSVGNGAYALLQDTGARPRTRSRRFRGTRSSGSREGGQEDVEHLDRTLLV
jgi:secretion/DNA translocation related TadE-like protein